MQHHAAIAMRIAASTRKLAPIYAQNNTRTPEHQMTRVMQQFQCDLQPEVPKHPKTTHTHKHTQSSFKPPLHCGKKNDKPTPAAPVAHMRYLSSSPAATLHGKTQGFVLRLPPQIIPEHSPCNIMQPLQCGSQHQLANLHLSTHRTTPEHQMTRVMQPFQCDPQSEIPKHPITTHTQAHLKAASSHRYTAAKKTTNRPQPHPSHTRGTFHRRLQPLYTEKHKVSCCGFLPNTSPMQHSCVTTSFHHHFPSSPLPFLTTSLPHHFPSSPLPFLTTSLPHHFPSSPLPFVTTSLRDHFPSSPLPFLITSLPHHFPSSPLPFVTTLSHSFLFFCYVLLCSVL